MAETGENQPTIVEELTDDTPLPPRRRWRLLARIGMVLGVLLLAAIAVLWFSREKIANNIIAGELKKRGIPATYAIEHIGPGGQVLKDIVVGDPKRPDLVIPRAAVTIRYRFGLPTVGKLVLEQPRLFGTLHDGKLSFGTLDPLIFTGGPKRQFELPRLDLTVKDGRGRLATDYGPIGLKLDGTGPLQDGFHGALAIAGRTLRQEDCTATDPSIYAVVTVKAKQVFVKGPARLPSLACSTRQMAARDASLTLDAALDKDFKGIDSGWNLRSGNVSFAGNGATALGAEGRAKWREGKIDATATYAANGLVTPYATFAVLTGDARLSTRANESQLSGKFDGSQAKVGPSLDRTLASAQAAGKDTLVAPLLAQMRAALAREGRSSRVAGSFDWRRTGETSRIVVPELTFTGGSGARVAQVSALQIVQTGKVAPQISGNIATGGPGLPVINGRMEQSGNGQSFLHLTMAPYRAGSSSLALPELALVQAANGTIGFSGRAELSGPLPGGSTRDMRLPISGNWSPGGGLSLWTRCVPIQFASLTYASLTLERRGLTLCPQRGGAIVRSDRNGFRFAAGTPSLDVAGRLGGTPIRIASGPVGVAWPGNLAARQVDVALGPAATASTFRISNLKARLGKDIAGTFDGSDISLFQVPLDLKGAAGTWAYRGGVLSIAGARFTLVDRSADPRFEPLVARDGRLTLKNNIIDATAMLRHPATDREVVRAVIRHNLANGSGRADLTVPGILFDNRVQPATLSRLMLGAIANARGTVRGTGQINWGPRGVTSTGDFSTDKLDFAAAFGPVKGARGTIHFSDLLNLETPPGQVLHVDSVNPGIEVNDGVVTFQLRRGLNLEVASATWPFMGGTLTMLPFNLRLGAVEERRFTLHVEGLDSAKFVERMGLANIRSTGIFDGDLPLVFNEGGGRIVNGHLKSRPPGGNISYVGVLTYKDLSPIANFAFDALKSLDYKEMDIVMNGSLQGELVTNVRFSGVKQGADAKRNFITKRFEGLPIQFNINIKAPFYQLIQTAKSLYDPAFVRDPRDLGLLDAEGRPIRQETVNPPMPAVKPDDIQPSESETVR